MLGLSTAARAGLTGFTATLAREVAPHGVTVNNLLPGFFETARLQRYFVDLAAARNVTPEQARAQRVAEVPVRRPGNPEEFGVWCAFLASAHAGYVTGQNIVLDGGAFPGVL
jgi:3-oxoacyl-[acyl-carrier protein] reductase